MITLFIWGIIVVLINVSISTEYLLIIRESSKIMGNSNNKDYLKWGITLFLVILGGLVGVHITWELLNNCPNTVCNLRDYI